MARYGKTFKHRTVARLLPPSSVALEVVAREVGRPSAVHPTPVHALREEERTKLLEVANEPRFAAVPLA